MDYIKILQEKFPSIMYVGETIEIDWIDGYTEVHTNCELDSYDDVELAPNDVVNGYDFLLDIESVLENCSDLFHVVDEDVIIKNEIVIDANNVELRAQIYTDNNSNINRILILMD